MGALVDLLLPPRCLACGAPTEPRRPGPDRPLCAACLEDVEADGVVHHLDDGVRALAPFTYADPLARAIKQVKTDGLRAGAAALATLLAPALPHGVPVTWVPAPPARARRRGLDLPAVLAGRAAVPLLRSARTRPDQPELGAAGRRAAALGAYAAVAAAPPAVVVVDDVRATGATLLAAATALRGAGAQRVLALSLAAVTGVPSAARPAPAASRSGELRRSG